MLAERHSHLPLTREGREKVHASLLEFGNQVDEYLRIDDEAEQEGMPSNVVKYGKAVGRAASDLQSRKARHEVVAALMDDLMD